MIDLHMHTNYSGDATDSLIGLLKKAEEAKLECISITDHDTCEVYEEMKSIDVSKYYTGKMIRGCEFTTTINGEGIELIGYNVDTDWLNLELPKTYKYSYPELQEFSTIRLIEICKAEGVVIDEEAIDLNAKISVREMHREIVRHEENRKFIKDERAWNSPSPFFREHVNNSDNIFFVDKTDWFPTLGETVELIRRAQGLVFIPHIFAYGEKAMKIFKELTENYHIDGIECHHEQHSKEETEFLVQYCKEHNLYISRRK
ncbi:MAG: PHP domain-containing protein [Oscillospiraceae bacterium]|nr:PHP domain-containing protein [Oscillospiraceae bacterium]